jgi:DNA repair photolyase
LRALARLRAADIETGINVMPVLPAITDSQESLESLVKAVAERDVSYLNTCSLRLRSTARARYLPFIEQEFPHLAKRYWATYGRSDKTSAAYSERLKQRVGELCARYGVPFGHNGRTGSGTDGIVQSDGQAEAISRRFLGESQFTLELDQ